MSIYRIYSAYEEFLKDEHDSQQCVNKTDIQQTDQINQATESIDELSKCKPARILTRRQSLRPVSAKHHLPDYYYYQHAKRPSKITKNSKNSPNQLNASEENNKENNNKYNGQTSQPMDNSKSQVEASDTQQRMEIDLSTELNYSGISEELNVPQLLTVTKSINVHEKDMTDDNLELAIAFDNNAVVSNKSGRNTKYRPFIIINDFCDFLKSNLSNNNVDFSDGTNEHSET